MPPSPSSSADLEKPQRGLSDHQLILELVARLGLTQTDNLWPGEKEYYDSPSNIVVGSGEGYSGFVVGFDFDDDGKFTKHYVVE